MTDIIYTSGLFPASSQRDDLNPPPVAHTCKQSHNYDFFKKTQHVQSRLTENVDIRKVGKNVEKTWKKGGKNGGKKGGKTVEKRWKNGGKKVEKRWKKRWKKGGKNVLCSILELETLATTAELCLSSLSYAYVHHSRCALRPSYYHVAVCDTGSCCH